MIRVDGLRAMEIENLIEEFHNGLNGRITAVELGDSVSVYFECDDWIKENVVRKFKITCISVKESTVAISAVDSIDFTQSDPVLWNHNEEHGYLYYSSECENNYELLGRLWEAHEKVYAGLRPLSECINATKSGGHIEFCKGAFGQLAAGPRPILNVYEVVIANKLATNFVPSYKPEGGFSALFFDNLFIVCKVVVVEELNSA
ncbi:MAG: hypothetical protein RL497_334 [Pseudomonadota bacterium]|jgi:hypothetical protein